MVRLDRLSTGDNSLTPKKNKSMEKSFYEPIKEIGTEKLNELKISVGYELGGMNYFSGGINKRGVYVYVKPVRRGEMFETSTLLGSRRESGFKVCVKELQRKSKKEIDAAIERVNSIKEDVAKLYDSCKFAEIRDLILGIA